MGRRLTLPLSGARAHTAALVALALAAPAAAHAQAASPPPSAPAAPEPTAAVVAGVATFDLSGTGNAPFVAARLDRTLAGRWLLGEVGLGAITPVHCILAMWQVCFCHMASKAAPRSRARGTTPETADLEELRARIRSGQRQGHYYVALLGLRTYEPLRLYASVRKGLAYSALERFQRNTSLPASVLADLAQIPQRTLARRKQEGRLDPEESDRLVRASRVFGRALELFEGDAQAAREWLSSEQLALGGLVPLELARTDVGAREVENLIGRLEHGIPT